MSQRSGLFDETACWTKRYYCKSELSIVTEKTSVTATLKMGSNNLAELRGNDIWGQFTFFLKRLIKYVLKTEIEPRRKK